MFHVKHNSIRFRPQSPFLRKGQARLRAGDRPTKKSCYTSRFCKTPTRHVSFVIHPASASYPPLPPFQRKRVDARTDSARKTILSCQCIFFGAMIIIINLVNS